VKEFVAAVADEQNNVDLSSAGDSVYSGDVLTNIIGKAIASVDGRVWRNPTLSKFLDDSYDEPSHIKGFRVTCLEQKVRALLFELFCYYYYNYVCICFVAWLLLLLVQNTLLTPLFDNDI